MGRPLKKSFFGSPATDGKQLILSYVWLEGSTAPEEGFYVVRQVGTGRYQVTNGVKTGVVKLVDALPDAPGEGVIIVQPYDSGTVEYASKIFNRTVKTFDGNSYKWSMEEASEEGEANLQFETWEDPLDVIEDEDTSLSFTAAPFEGGIGYISSVVFGGPAGSITNEGEFMGFRVLAIYDSSNGMATVVLEGELDDVQSLDVSVGGNSIILQQTGMGDGQTTFEQEEAYGLTPNNYVIDRIVDITNL